MGRQGLPSRLTGSSDSKSTFGVKQEGGQHSVSQRRVWTACPVEGRARRRFQRQNRDQGLQGPGAKCRESEARQVSVGLQLAARVPVSLDCLRKEAGFTRPEMSADNLLAVTARVQGLSVLRCHTALPPQNPPPPLPIPLAICFFLGFCLQLLPSPPSTFPCPIRLKSGQIRTQVFQPPTALFHVCPSVDNKTLRNQEHSFF